MARLNPLSEADLNPEQRRVYEAISGRARAGLGLVGPFGVYLRAPKVGDPAQALGAALRAETRIPASAREVAVLTVCADARSKFAFAAHADIAEGLGIDPHVIDAIRLRESPNFAREDEQVAHAVARETLASKRITDDTYKLALALFGEEQLVELILTIGYYSLATIAVNAFEVELLDNMVDPFPECP